MRSAVSQCAAGDARLKWRCQGGGLNRRESGKTFWLLNLALQTSFQFQFLATHSTVLCTALCISILIWFSSDVFNVAHVISTLIRLSHYAAIKFIVLSFSTINEHKAFASMCIFHLRRQSNIQQVSTFWEVCPHTSTPIGPAGELRPPDLLCCVRRCKFLARLVHASHSVQQQQQQQQRIQMQTAASYQCDDSTSHHIPVIISIIVYHIHTCIRYLTQYSQHQLQASVITGPASST